MHLYKIINTINNRLYIGITKSSLNRRFNSHRFCANSGKNTPLYNAMRKYGFDSFKIELIQTYSSWIELQEAEKYLIASSTNLYNLAKGGEGGFNIQDIESWKAKLKEARKGHKPFLNGKHTEETKRKCAEASKRYWALQRACSNEPC